MFIFSVGSSHDEYFKLLQSQSGLEYFKLLQFKPQLEYFQLNATGANSYQIKQSLQYYLRQTRGEVGTNYVDILV